MHSSEVRTSYNTITPLRSGLVRTPGPSQLILPEMQLQLHLGSLRAPRFCCQNLPQPTIDLLVFSCRWGRDARSFFADRYTVYREFARTRTARLASSQSPSAPRGVASESSELFSPVMRLYQPYLGNSFTR